MKKTVIALTLLLAFACTKEQRPLVIGSKNFTESVILGELLAQKLEAGGCKVERRLNMGGTFVCDAAVRGGSIDAYVEYSGTALTAILHRDITNDRAAVMRDVAAEYAKRGLQWGPPLGFENTFAIIVRRADAERHQLRRISDLARVAETFRPGFGYEFVERPDGWSGLQQHYGLQFKTAPKTMDLGLTYRALGSNAIDVIAGNSTDGLIDALGLVVLEDDRRFFPPYDTVIVARTDMAKKCAAASDALRSLENAIDEAEMRRLNHAIDGEKRAPADVAREALARIAKGPL